MMDVVSKWINLCSGISSTSTQPGPAVVSKGRLMHLEVALGLQVNSCSQVLYILSEVVGFESFINLTLGMCDPRTFIWLSGVKTI